MSDSTEAKPRKYGGPVPVGAVMEQVGLTALEVQPGTEARVNILSKDVWAYLLHFETELGFFHNAPFMIPPGVQSEPRPTYFFPIIIYDWNMREGRVASEEVRFSMLRIGGASYEKKILPLSRANGGALNHLDLLVTPDNPKYKTHNYTVYNDPRRGLRPLWWDFKTAAEVKVKAAKFLAFYKAKIETTAGRHYGSIQEIMQKRTEWAAQRGTALPNASIPLGQQPTLESFDPEALLESQSGPSTGGLDDIPFGTDAGQGQPVDVAPEAEDDLPMGEEAAIDGVEDIEGADADLADLGPPPAQPQKARPATKLATMPPKTTPAVPASKGPARAPVRTKLD